MRRTPAHSPLLLEWSFADRLRKVRRDVAKVGQAEFAQALDVKLKAYSAWESGKNTPRELVAIAKRIELVTGVSASWMLGVTDVVQVPLRTGTEGGVSAGVSGRCPRTNPRVVIPFPQASRMRRGYHSRKDIAIKRGVRPPTAENSGHPYAAPVA